MSEVRGVEVVLEAPEFVAAVHAGLMRFVTSPGNPATTYERSYNKRIEEEIVGACAEAAWHKFRNQYFDAAYGTYHKVPDAAGSVEVRATKLDSGSLIVRDNDADARIYVLVTGEAPRLRICGYLTGKDAKQDKYLRNPNGYRKAWFIPQAGLTPIREAWRK